MTARTNLILDMEGAGISAKLFFNGVVLMQDVMTVRLSRAVRLNGWAVSGVNTLQLSLEYLPSPVGNAPPVLSTPRFSLKLRSVFPGTPDSSEQVLVDYKWDLASQPLPLSGSSEVLSQNLQLSAPAVWSWTRAMPVAQLTAEDTREIGGMLAQLHAALVARSIPDVIRMQEIQVGEQAVAAGELPRDFLQMYDEFLRERMASSDWKVFPLIWDNLKLTTMAGGRIYRITDARGFPPIVSTASGSIFAIEPYCSKVDGRWIIVR